MSVYDDVEREARHDWLDERPAREPVDAAAVDEPWRRVDLVEMEVDAETAKQIKVWAAFKGIPDWQVVHWVLAEYVQNHMPPSHGCFH